MWLRPYCPYWSLGVNSLIGTQVYNKFCIDAYRDSFVQMISWRCPPPLVQRQLGPASATHNSEQDKWLGKWMNEDYTWRYLLMEPTSYLKLWSHSGPQNCHFKSLGADCSIIQSSCHQSLKCSFESITNEASEEDLQPEFLTSLSIQSSDSGETIRRCETGCQKVVCGGVATCRVKRQGKQNAQGVRLVLFQTNTNHFCLHIPTVQPTAPTGANSNSFTEATFLQQQISGFWGLSAEGWLKYAQAKGKKFFIMWELLV